MKNRDEFLRDVNIKKQIESFIDFFININDDVIDKYIENSMMDLSDFIQYLEDSKNRLSLNKNNDVYGHLVDEYCNKVDEIIKRKI